MQTLVDEVHSVCAQQMSAIRDGRGARDAQRLIASLRDNISYRFGSVLWHHDYLSQLLSHLATQLLPAHLAEGESTSFLLRAAHQISFVFDDIVFNIASSFDYLARLVGFLTLGSKGAGLKWNALVNHARSGAPALHQSGLTQLIIRMGREFVNPLQEYRGDLIHRDRMMGTIEGSLHFGKERVSATLVVSAPDALAKVLTGKASFKDQQPPDVLVASATLIQGTVECGFSLMRALAKPMAPSA